MKLEEVKVLNRWIELHTLESDPNPDKEHIVIPPLMAYLPLAVWGAANDYTILTEAPWEYNRPYKVTPRPEEYPENYSVARLRMLAVDDDRGGVRNHTSHPVSGELSPLHGPDDDVFWNTVTELCAHYDVIQSNGSSWVAVVHPDLFIYEDEDDTYHVFSTGMTAPTETYSVLDGAVEAFAHPAMRDQGSLSDHYNEEWYSDYRLTELRIQSAAASKRFDRAAQLAMNHFGLPIASVKNRDKIQIKEKDMETICEWCNKTFTDNKTTIRHSCVDGICDDCINKEYIDCADCGDLTSRDSVVGIKDGEADDGHYYVCEDCSKQAERCDFCEELAWHTLTLTVPKRLLWNDSQNAFEVCTACAEEALVK